MTSISSALGSTNLADLRKQLFSAADADGSGTLSLTEFQKISQQALQSTGIIPDNQQGATQSLEQIFKKLDTNNDGQLTSAEIEQGAQITDQIRNVLLQIQEIQSGGALSAILGGNGSSSSSDISSLFGGSSSTDPYASLFGDSSSGDDSISSLYSTLLGTGSSNGNIAKVSQLLSGTDSSGNSFTDNLSSLIQQVLASYQGTQNAAANTDGSQTTTTQIA